MVMNGRCPLIILDKRVSMMVVGAWCYSILVIRNGDDRHCAVHSILYGVRVQVRHVAPITQNRSHTKTRILYNGSTFIMADKNVQQDGNDVGL